MGIKRKLIIYSILCWCSFILNWSTKYFSLLFCVTADFPQVSPHNNVYFRILIRKMASRTIRFSTDEVLSFFNADDSTNESDSNVDESFSESRQSFSPSKAPKSTEKEDEIATNVSELDNGRIQETNDIENPIEGTRSVDNKDLWPWGARILTQAVKKIQLMMNLILKQLIMTLLWILLTHNVLVMMSLQKVS